MRRTPWLLTGDEAALRQVADELARPPHGARVLSPSDRRAPAVLRVALEDHEAQALRALLPNLVQLEPDVPLPDIRPMPPPFA